MAEPAGTRDVAIVGMAAVFPGAADLAAYWRNLEAGVDAITEVPPTRWDPVFYDPAAAGHAPDRLYCRRGGFVDADAVFDPVAFGIMPVAARGAEPDQLLALQTAARALDDAGYGAGGRAIARDRAAVILGRGGYLTPGMARLVDRVRTPQQLVTTLAELVPGLDAETLAKVRAAFQARGGDLGPETAIGLVPNLAASRIANRLDLHGPAYTVDAACASSLLAVDQACRELTDHRCDVVLAGGVHVCHDITFWSVFTQLGALSRSQTVRPFDRRADGILIGEGAGVVVLKRLADAERDGDRVYAVIKGVGVSSDGRESSPMRPRLEGQRAALAGAWRAAGCDPDEVGLVEAHGTGTPAGDEVELQALGAFFGEAPPRRPRAALGSVKSMIGHAMPAAGAAGLIKAALALHHGVLPPTLHCEEPHAELARTRFRTLAAAEPWGELPRRAGVSAFGFGGINAHVVVEAHARAGRPRRRATDVVPTPPPAPLLALAAPSIDALRAALDRGAESGGGGPVRLAMLDPTPERRELARKVLDRGRPWRGNRDLWFSPAGLGAAGGKLAFVFPGIEVGFAPRIADVVERFGLAPPPALAAAVAVDGTTGALEQQGLGVFALGRMLVTALARLGVRADVMAGHSVGEWTAMVASELVPPDTIDAFVAGLPAGSLEVPDVIFAAVGCGVDGARAAIEGLPAIAVSHDNCPHQSIVCGRTDSVRAALDRLGARGVLCQELPFKSGFHSPLLADHLGLHRRHFAALALGRARVPVWSATTCAPYPTDHAAIRALAIDHLVQPVRFRELVDRLYEDGVRAFVQLGVGSLVNFVGDTLRDRDHVAIAAASDKQPGLTQLARVVGALFAEGFEPRAEDPAPAAVVAPPPAPRPSLRLELGAPLVHLGGAVPPLRLAGAGDAPIAPATGDPVVDELLATFREAATASQAVVDAWRRAAHAPARPAIAIAPPPPAPAPVPAPRPSSLTTRRTFSVEAEPALLDHCFYRQPAGWPTVSDRYPVVPMTTMVGVMLDAARALVPDRVAIAAEDVRAHRWLAVAPPVELAIQAKLTAPDTVEVELPGYARATVRMAAGYPPAPAPALAPLDDAHRPAITAAEMYRDRWMFHGPAYQGVVELGPTGDRGVDGVIAVLPAPGALLDCAGQLMGWWVMDREVIDRLAMPVRIERIALYGPEPRAGRVACRVRFRSLDARDAHADLELTVDGRVWARIDDWQDRRFDSDAPLWDVLMYPETHALAIPRPDGPAVVTEHWRGAASRDMVMRRYLGERERAELEQVGVRGRRSWLLGRIALKDAVRLHQWARGGGPRFPVEIQVANLPSGQPIVTGPGCEGLRVSVAHKDDVAVALVTDDGRAPGVDVERIAPRTDAFVRVAFGDRELALGADRPRDEHMTRLWAAKEAVGKARGTGLGDPRRYQATAADGDRLIVDGTPVETRRDGDLIVAWTTEEQS